MQRGLFYEKFIEMVNLSSGETIITTSGTRTYTIPSAGTITARVEGAGGDAGSGGGNGGNSNFIVGTFTVSANSYLLKYGAALKLSMLILAEFNDTI